MKNLKLIFTLLFGVLMILGGVNHFITPEMYDPFIPDFLPKLAVNYATGIFEILGGVGVFMPRFRSLATLSILVMMLIFLPLHIYDVFQVNPAIGTHQAALIRLPVQFILILWAWSIHKK